MGPKFNGDLIYLKKQCERLSPPGLIGDYPQDTCTFDALDRGSATISMFLELLITQSKLYAS